MPTEKLRIRLVYFLARWGCFSIGVVYLLIGVVSLLSLLGLKDGGADEDSILDSLRALPLGELLIWLLIGGLIGYSVWRVFEAITDPYEFGKEPKGLAIRAGVALSAIAYAMMVYAALQAYMEDGSGADNEVEQQLLVAKVLGWQAGRWLIGAVGLITAITALVQFKFVIAGDHNPRLSVSHLSIAFRKTIDVLAWAGYFARGIILLVLSYFFFMAAFKDSPWEIGNTDTAFDFIGKGIIGHSLFVLVGLGTIAYGLFMFVFGVYYSFQKGGASSLGQ